MKKIPITPQSGANENGSLFRNFYEHCGHAWQDVWDSACNDECPGCSAEIEPIRSVELIEIDAPELSPAERNTILAALRTYQEARYGDPANRPDRINDIACPTISDTSLDDAGIDELCERLNV